MKMIDPTYLRTIHDGLLSGTIHKDNASALPVGLVGMYDEALPPAANVNERKRFLEFFAVWALLKKEVSAAFVVPLLEDWTEEEVLNFIGHYSKWFNSPVIGSYVLYHERLRNFVLGKINEKVISDKSLRIIQLLEFALISNLNSEAEFYALEFYSDYIFYDLDSQSKENILKTSVSINYWERQVEISSKFNWSRNSIFNCISYLNQHQDNRLANYYLKLIELKHREEQGIVYAAKLFAEKKYKLAIDRLRNISYSGYSAQSKQYTGYVLCLLELLKSNKGYFDAVDAQPLKEILADLEDKRFDISWFMPTGLLLMIYIEAKRIGLDAKFLFNSVYLDCNKYIQNARFDDSELLWLVNLIIFKAKDKNVEEQLVLYFNSIKGNYTTVVFNSFLQKYRYNFTEIETEKLMNLLNDSTKYDPKADEKKQFVPIEIHEKSKYIGLETHTSDVIDKFITNNSYVNVKSNLDELGALLSQFTYGMHEESDRDDILKNTRKSLVKHKKYNKAIEIIPQDRENGIVEVVKFISDHHSLEDSQPYLSQISNANKKDKIIFEIAVDKIKVGKYDDGLQLFQYVYKNIIQYQVSDQNIEFALKVAIELSKLNCKAEANVLLNKFLVELPKIYSNVKKHDKERIYRKMRLERYFMYLNYFNESALLISFLKENKAIEKDYSNYLLGLSRKTPNTLPSRTNELEDLNSLDVDGINRLSNDISIDKIDAMEREFGYSTKLASLVNRFLFFKDIAYVQEMDIRKHLWVQRYELDELEIFLNIWALYRMFITEDESISKDWIENLHLHWAEEIKNQLPS